MKAGISLPADSDRNFSSLFVFAPSKPLLKSLTPYIRQSMPVTKLNNINGAGFLIIVRSPLRTPDKSC
jgi:hypothetical protein